MDDVKLPDDDDVPSLDRERTKRAGVWAEVRIVWVGDEIKMALGGEAEENPTWAVKGLLDAAELLTNIIERGMDEQTAEPPSDAREADVIPFPGPRAS